MSKRYLLLFGVIISLLLIVVVFLAFQQKNSSTPQTYLVPSPSSTLQSQTMNDSNHTTYSISSALPSPTILADAITPMDIVKLFYSWYISSSQNPVTSGSYLHNKYLSSEFKNQITSLAAHSNTYDPVLCNQNKTQNFLVGEPTYNELGNQAKVIVSANVPNGKDLYRFVLDYTAGKWLISDIICIP